MNSVEIIGNLTRDPQIRSTKSGKSVASFSVAVNRKYVAPDGTEKEVADFVNVVAWGSLAEAVGNQLHKGTRVFVEGRYSTRTYESQQGEKRYVTEVNANIIALPLDARPQRDTSGFNQFGNPIQEPQQYSQGNFGEDVPF